MLRKQEIKIKGDVVHFEPPRMLTDYAEKGNLPNYIQSRKNELDERHPAIWITQIADAMKYLEGKKIVHRDLAARNILVVDEFKVCVSDFGLAKMISVNDNNESDKYCLDTRNC